ncbi:nitroreductase family protein [Candidatus Bipolaricaulota bacterium]|nr:nitroreductase family protein [Candidatus Bipolaricaulota bacterium]
MTDLLSVIQGRRSVLRFKPDPIPEEDLRKILEAGRWAPSYANSQPWKFIVVRNPQTIKALGSVVGEGSHLSAWSCGPDCGRTGRGSRGDRRGGRSR